LQLPQGRPGTLRRESDLVSIHVPLTDDTRNLIGANRLRRMKPTAILVNTSRGAVVDQEASGTALREGWIAGAGLDVFVQSASRVSIPCSTCPM